MCKAIEKSLANCGMGLPEMISEMDALVFADEEILIGRYVAKDRRSARIENGVNREARRSNNKRRKAVRISKAEKGHNKYAPDVDYCYRKTVVGEDGHLDENKVYHPEECVWQLTTVKPLKHPGKTVATVRRDDNVGCYDTMTDAELFDLGACDCNLRETVRRIADECFEAENGETWETTLARRKFNAESAWVLHNSIIRAKGFYEAKELVRLNHEVEVIQAKKKALLEEYAEKVERLNKHLRNRMDKIAVLKGEEPMFGF